MTDDAARYLAIFLNDHLAAATAASELLDRMQGQYEGTELGTFAAGLSGDLAADRATLKAAMAAHGVRLRRPKLAGAWIAEKAGRLKFNGHLVRQSPLSPLVELETLAVALHGKLLLWRALQAAGWESAAGTPLDELVARAARQHEAVERHHRDAARTALTPARAR